MCVHVCGCKEQFSQSCHHMHVKTGSNDLVYHKNECNDNSLNSHCNIAVLERLVSIIVHHLPHYLWASLDAKATLWHAQWIWVINGLFSFCSFILTLFWCHHHMCTGWSKSSDFIKVSIFWSMHLLHRKDDSLCGASMNLKKKNQSSAFFVWQLSSTQSVSC